MVPQIDEKNWPEAKLPGGARKMVRAGW